MTSPSYSISHILCATDLSPSSEVAFTKSVATAKCLGAKLTLVFVSASTDDNSAISSLFAMSREMKRLADDMLTRDTKALDGLVAKAQADGVDTTRLMLQGEPATEIANAAIDVDADLVVTATHGREGLEKFLLGSVTERLVHTCTRPMMVARNDGSHCEAGYRKILVPTDFSLRAGHALDVALALAAPDAEIELVHCWRLPIGVSGGPASIVDSIRRSLARDIRKRGQAELKKINSDARLSFFAVEKAAGLGVTERAAAIGSELVVMGTHARSGLSHFLLGSVAETVLHYAECSVIVVPNHAEKDALT